MMGFDRKSALQLVFQICAYHYCFTTFAMEENSNIRELPTEIGSIIAEFAKLSTHHVIALKQNGNQPERYFVLISEFNEKYSLRDKVSYGNDWKGKGDGSESSSSSCNLNSLDIATKIQYGWYAEEFDRFSQDCWFGGREYNTSALDYSAYRNYYRIDDHCNKRRYLKFNYHISYQSTLVHFFDGFNDNAIFLVIENCNNQRGPHKTYNLLLGKMADTHAKAYKSNKRYPGNSSRKDPNNESKENTLFDYESINNPGNIAAFALCKIANRFVLTDNKRKINIYDITESAQDNALTVSNITGTAPVAIKKISFITPTTLLALSEKGKLFIVAADPGNPIKFFKQRFRKNDKNKTPLLFSHCAVDPCNPYQVLLLSKDNQCIYWDLINKQLIPILEIKDTVQSLWFYNHIFGYSDAKNNFKKYHLKYMTTEDQAIFSTLLKNFASSTRITSLNRKNKKLHNFVRSLIATTAIITGLASLYFDLKRHKYL